MKNTFLIIFLTFACYSFAQVTDIKTVKIDGEFKLPNVIAPLDYSDDEIYATNASRYLPVKDSVFFEQVRKGLSPKEEKQMEKQFAERQKELVKSKYAKLTGLPVRVVAEGDVVWIGTDDGLFFLIKIRACRSA